MCEIVLQYLVSQGKLTVDKFKYLEPNIIDEEMKLLAYSTLGHYEQALKIYSQLT